jgi:hypothetical protein
MIGLVTNLVCFQRLSVKLVSPDANPLGLLALDSRRDSRRSDRRGRSCPVRIRLMK